MLNVKAGRFAYVSTLFELRLVVNSAAGVCLSRSTTTLRKSKILPQFIPASELTPAASQDQLYSNTARLIAMQGKGAAAGFMSHVISR